MTTQYLRDVGGEDECWVPCAKGDPGATEFVALRYDVPVSTPELIDSIRHQNWKNGGALTVDVAEAEAMVQDMIDEAVRTRTAELEKEIKDLEVKLQLTEDENSTLAAGACKHRGGNEHGNPFCTKFKINL